MSEITLYYAEWCGHCQQFKPTWEALKPMFDKHNIKHAEYEDNTNSDMITKAGIEGFPTIRIKKQGQEYDYSGQRTPDAILHELITNLKGGGNSRRYKINYL